MEKYEFLKCRNGYIFESDEYEKIKKGLFDVLKKELPEKTQTQEVISYIFEKIVEDISSLQIKL